MIFTGSLTGFAEYYRYRDENGILHFSDTLPERYAGQATVFPDSISRPQAIPTRATPHRPAEPIESGLKQKTLPQEKTTPFVIQKSRILLPVEIVGTRGRTTVHLIMDTGAQRTFLWRTALPSIGLQRIGRVRAAGIAGSKYASSVRARSINVGPYQIKNVEMAVMTPGRYQKNYDGLLGMDFLMQVKFEIDYDRKVIIWKGIN